MRLFFELFIHLLHNFIDRQDFSSKDFVRCLTPFLDLLLIGSVLACASCQDVFNLINIDSSASTLVLYLSPLDNHCDTKYLHAEPVPRRTNSSKKGQPATPSRRWRGLDGEERAGHAAASCQMFVPGLVKDVGLDVIEMIGEGLEADEAKKDEGMGDRHTAKWL